MSLSGVAERSVYTGIKTLGTYSREALILLNTSIVSCATSARGLIVRNVVRICLLVFHFVSETSHRGRFLDIP